MNATTDTEQYDEDDVEDVLAFQERYHRGFGREGCTCEQHFEYDPADTRGASSRAPVDRATREARSARSEADGRVSARHHRRSTVSRPRLSHSPLACPTPCAPILAARACRTCAEPTTPWP